jgi:hypothetical protein
MFRVSTLDLENLPRNDQGKVDFSEDFFGKEAFLTGFQDPALRRGTSHRHLQYPRR